MIKISPFEALYGQNPVLTLSVLSMASLAGSKSADANMWLITDKLICLQDLASKSLIKDTSCESVNQNTTLWEMSTY